MHQGDSDPHDLHPVLVRFNPARYLDGRADPQLRAANDAVVRVEPGQHRDLAVAVVVLYLLAPMIRNIGSLLVRILKSPARMA